MLRAIEVTRLRSASVRALAVSFAIVAIAAVVPAQQLNTPTSALSVSGTGVVDAASMAVPTNCMLSPTPAGSAPFFHHRAAARAPVELRIDGPPLQPIVLALSSGIAATPIFTPAGLLEIDALAGIEILIDGIVPTNLISQAAWTGASGKWSLVLPPGLPATMPLFHLQGLAVNPALPTGVALTASVTVEVRNDIETCTRAFLDALTQVAENPIYVLGAASSGFLTQGLDAANLGALLTAEASPFAYVGIGPNLPTDPALPTGGPTSGQSRTIQIGLTEQESPGCGSPAARGGHEEIHDWVVIEDGGVWKIHGDRRDLFVEATLSFLANPSNPQGFDTILNLIAEDETAAHGGVASVQVSGPQLASVVGGQSQSSTSGVQSLILVDGGGTNETSEWEFQVQIGAAGTSRQALVENATGPRDVYSLTVTWNDGYVSSPYALALRAAIDPDAAPAAIVAAIPGTTGPVPSPTLSNAGTAGATLAVTLDVGALPAGTSGAFGFGLEQAPFPGIFYDWELDDMLLPSHSGVQSFTFCVPWMASGSTVSGGIGRSDVHSCDYVLGLSFTP